MRARVELKDGKVHVTLAGEIDEASDFKSALGELPAGAQEMVIYAKGVARINSSGVKNWIAYFEGLARGGMKLRFVECSPPLIEQLNLIRNFLAGGAIDSVCVPFLCEKCQKQYVVVYPIERLRKEYRALPHPKCAICGGKTEFDDIEDSYFTFLS